MSKDDPQQKLTSIVERFKRVSRDLFSFSTSETEFITWKRGLYAYLLAKPARRLATALSLDREVLILFSWFEDQQQRTLDTVREVIGKYSGRLEPTIAIVVHNDREGNAKLAKWGRTLAARGRSPEFAAERL